MSHRHHGGSHHGSSRHHRPRRPRSDELVRVREQPDGRQSLSDSIAHDHFHHYEYDEEPITFRSSGSHAGRDLPPGTIETWLGGQGRDDDHYRNDVSQSALDAVGGSGGGGLDSRATTVPSSSSLTTPTSQQAVTGRRRAKRESKGKGKRREERYEEEDAAGETDYEAEERDRRERRSRENISRDLRGVGTFASETKPRRRRKHEHHHTALRDWFPKWL